MHTTIRSTKWVFIAAAIVGMVVAAALLTLHTANGSSRPHITPADVHQLAKQAQGDGAGASVAAALADGAVTRDQYRAAVHATMQCLEDAGVSVHDVRDTGDRIQFQFGGGQISHEELAAQKAVYERCYNQYERAVDIAWAGQH
ncbi:hypothetical protein J0H33_14615 [bacterium]|nr:hypothetical protein [bacterium]